MPKQKQWSFLSWNVNGIRAAEKKGYSGVGTYSKVQPKVVTTGLNEARFDTEGRVLVSEFEPFVFLSTREYKGAIFQRVWGIPCLLTYPM